MSSKSSKVIETKESKSFFRLFAELLDPELSPIRSTYNFVPLNIIVNIQKLGALFFTFFAMCYYNNFSTGCWVYLGLHGSYGLIWVIKDYSFPDKTFQKNIGLIELLLVLILLISYYTFPYMIVTGIAKEPSNERIFISIMMYTIGVFLMVTTDIQKYIRLKYKKGLIDDCMIALNRNTNYFGEMLLYGGFANLANEFTGYMVLLIVWSTVFFSRIYLKEQSLIKKEGYQEYSKKSFLLLFKFFSSDIINYIFYITFALVCYLTYNAGGIENTIKLLIKK